MRTLQLLEGHHKKLAEILRFQHEHPSSAAVAAETTASPALTSGLNAQPTTKPTAWTQDAQQQPPRLSGNTRLPTRETSSIASNLASARGIPSQPRRASPASPTLSSQQAGARMTESPTKSRTGESRLRGTQSQGTKDRSGRVSAPKQPWSPSNVSPTDITSRQVLPPEAVESSRQKERASVAEEPFQRFYSTFEGLISKLSAPLAFAGLPLGADVSGQADSTRRKSSAETKLDHRHAMPDRSSGSTEQDVNKLFSKSALRAIRDSTGGGTGSTSESFYVVPTTGGTVSYAGILTRAEKEARRRSVDEGDEEDFVDARETPSSPEMRHSMTKGRAGRGADKLTTPQSPKTMEELQMENQALKHLSDTMSKRLHMWEVNAQSSSMALQQSLRAMHHVSPENHHQPSGSTVTSPVTPLPATSGTDHEQRIKELEDIVRSNEKELGQVGRENEKLRDVLGRYRERWEKLKEGAKTRRAETQAGQQRQPQQQSQHQPSRSRNKDENEANQVTPTTLPPPTTTATKTQEDPENASTKTDTETGNEGPESESKGNSDN